MKLEEQFLPYCDHEYANREDNSANCAEIAENFAIGFHEFVIKNAYKTQIETTTKELLEIYKKTL